MTFRSDPATGCGWMIVIAAALLATVALLAAGFLIGRASAVSRSQPDIPASAFRPVIVAVRVPSLEPDRAATGTPQGVPPSPGIAPSVASPRPVESVTGQLVGTASWGCCWAGVVTRLPRGTAIRVCGALGCWSGRSVGYGPAKWTGRIADLSPSVFEAVCGRLSMGLCRVTLWSW